jgi:aarF domain-containing kinase
VLEQHYRSLMCPASYRVTLNQNDKTEDDEEKLVALKACHKRCANRTLEVIERNGSIFIKLGQHLVNLLHSCREAGY